MAFNDPVVRPMRVPDAEAVDVRSLAEEDVVRRARRVVAAFDVALEREARELVAAERAAERRARADRRHYA